MRDHWWRDAMCLGSGVNFEALTDEVKELCDACPVRNDCLDSAIVEEGDARWDSRHLVRGGMMPLARYRIAVERGLVATPTPQTVGDCPDCGVGLIAGRLWVVATKAQRDEWRAAGMGKAAGYGRCDRHATAHKRRLFGRPSRAA